MDAPDRDGDTVGSIEGTYAVAFHDIWEAALSSARGMKGWEVLERDSRAGELRLQTLNRLGRVPMELWVRLWLDDLGQTRLEVRFEEPRNLLRRSPGHSRATRFLGHLDRALGPPRRR